MKNWFTPIRILVVYLVALAAVATLSWSRLDLLEWATAMRNFSLLFVPSYLTYQLLLKLGWAKPTRIEHRLITTLILFLLFDPAVAWWAFPVLAVVTEIISRLVRFPTGPIFNPAAAGAVVMTVLGIFPGWWGASFAPRIPLIPGGMSTVIFHSLPIVGYVIWKYRKIPVVVSAAAVFGVAYLLVFRANPVFILIEGTLTFFLLVMAAEPKTSPTLRNEQLIYGSLIGLLAVVGMRFAWNEPFCMALLTANLVLGLYKNRKWLQGKFGPKVSTPQTVSV